MKSFSIWSVPLSYSEIFYPTLQEVILHQAKLLHAAITQGIRNKRLLLEPFLRPTAMMDSEQERTAKKKPHKSQLLVKLIYLLN